LVLCLWFTEQKTSARWTALIGLAAIIAGYGEFHRNLMAQQQLNIPNSEMRLPVPAIAIMAIGLLLTVAIGVSRVSQRAPGAGIRLIGLVALVAVMIQGLLGGFRVKLNELVGTDLAAVHGIFAQVVMTILVLLAVRTERSPAAPPDSPGLRTIRLTSHILAALVFVQIVWGALVRHDPTPLNQRLHFLTAFLALALGVIVLRAIFVRPELRSQAGLLPAVMCGLLAVQIYLGVEAWMVKFGMYTLPELVPVTRENAAIRTLHALVGSALLMTSIGLMVRMGRRTPAERPNGDGGRTDWYEAEVVQNRVAVAAETYQGNTP
jgi:heme A synthase